MTTNTQVDNNRKPSLDMSTDDAPTPDDPQKTAVTRKDSDAKKLAQCLLLPIRASKKVHSKYPDNPCRPKSIHGSINLSNSCLSTKNFYDIGVLETSNVSPVDVTLTKCTSIQHKNEGQRENSDLCPPLEVMKCNSVATVGSFGSLHSQVSGQISQRLKGISKNAKGYRSGYSRNVREVDQDDFIASDIRNIKTKSVAICQRGTDLKRLYIDPEIGMALASNQMTRPIVHSATNAHDRIMRAKSLDAARHDNTHKEAKSIKLGTLHENVSQIMTPKLRRNRNSAKISLLQQKENKMREFRECLDDSLKSTHEAYDCGPISIEPRKKRYSMPVFPLNYESYDKEAPACASPGEVCQIQYLDTQNEVSGMPGQDDEDQDDHDDDRPITIDEDPVISSIVDQASQFKNITRSYSYAQPISPNIATCGSVNALSIIEKSKSTSARFKPQGYVRYTRKVPYAQADVQQNHPDLSTCVSLTSVTNFGPRTSIITQAPQDIHEMFVEDEDNRGRVTPFGNGNKISRHPVYVNAGSIGKSHNHIPLGPTIPVYPPIHLKNVQRSNSTASHGILAKFGPKSNYTVARTLALSRDNMRSYDSCMTESTRGTFNLDSRSRKLEGNGRYSYSRVSNRTSGSSGFGSQRY